MPNPDNTYRSLLDAPWMLPRLATASWETIFHRVVLMVSGTCSAAEYRRMVAEKMDASHSATMALLTGQGGAAAITLSPGGDRERHTATRLTPTTRPAAR